MTRTTTIIAMLALLVLSSSAWAMDGSGTDTDPYIITNVEELQAMTDDLSAHYQLGNDIDASTTAAWNSGAGFEPVGDDVNVFTGVFDGQGHTITGLYINRPTTDGVGVFGYLRDGAEVKNVGLVDANVTAHLNSGTLVGSSSGATVSKSWSSGEIRGSHNYQMRLGGLIGISSGANSYVYQCFSSVNVTATGGAHQIGGLAGYNGHGSIMSDCYATGDVSGYWKVGGLVGDNPYPEGGYITRCYSTGRVSGNGGGLVGFNYNGGKTYDSYWDTETSGKTSSYGGEPRTTAQMMQQATFVNWDFNEVWNIIENETYPFFGEPPVLIGLEVTGPDEVPENSSTNYAAIAHYDNNSTRDVTGLAAWSVEPNSLADIDEHGLLTTQPINYLYEDITIYAQYITESNTVDAEKPVSVFAVCPSGSALQFDGINDYVEVNNPDNLNFGGTIDFTFAAWIRAETAQRKHPAIIGRRNVSNAHGYIFFLHSYEKLAVQLNDGIHSNYVSTGPDLRDDTWHHVAATGDRDGYLIFYIDGVQAGQSNISGKGNIDSTANLYIGWEERHSTVTYFNGIIDEVAIYNRALSAEEIQENVHNTLTGAEPNLIAYWPFDEGEGQVAYDLSSNANHGWLGSDPDVDGNDPAWVDSGAPVGICTADQLIERHVTDAMQIKQNILAELDEAVIKEHAAFYILQELFINPDNVDLTKRQILMLRQLIRSALQRQRQTEATLQESIEKLEDASGVLDGDINVNSVTKRRILSGGKRK
ncbi:MAG: hypothetical protein JSV99_07585 [Planctomycetota bacterium]|nr:MAG: hypothetical protein JSV99_07585 [Planctomycetota bacterium]